MIPAIAGSVPTPPTPPSAPSAASSTSHGQGGFAHAVGSLFDSLQQVQSQAASSSAAAAAGQGSATDALITATQAGLETQLTSALTSQAVQAFTDIMNIQL
ncbi:MAG: flagellar hook-basal body complex protein FliE [Actinobacteria bacterium]|nr:flagellar hook-basal body complex protein FliE [Actinomycetota bacterium]